MNFQTTPTAANHHDATNFVGWVERSDTHAVQFNENLDSLPACAGMTESAEPERTLGSILDFVRYIWGKIRCAQRTLRPLAH
jgi:hypothetical protein